MMRVPALFLVPCLLLAAPAPVPARAGDMMTPMPDTSVSCNGEYTKAAAAYTPIVGDIMRFDAMLENYAALCGKAGEAKDLKPFVDTMRARADRDVEDSYHVMTRIIRGVLPARVDSACRDDKGAQEFTLARFHKMMDAQRHKTENRLKRSADGIDAEESTQVCRSLADIKADFEKHTAGKDFSNPLFEIAFLRGMIAPKAGDDSRAYNTYRDILKGMQDERAAKKP